MLTSCPTPEFVARYRSGGLKNLAEALAFDEHLHTCGACRNTLRAQTRHAAPALAASLIPEGDHSAHVDDSHMLAFVRDELEAVDREIVESHLTLCALCTADVAELRAFHRQMKQADFARQEQEIAQPTFRERITLAFAAFTHAFGVENAHRVSVWWSARSLNFRLMLALGGGVLTGYLMRGHTSGLHDARDVFLALLQALATPFIFVAIVHTLMDVEVTGRTARRLIYLALSNTLIAVGIGLFVGNVAQPGTGATLPLPRLTAPSDPLHGLNTHVPRTLLQPLLENNILFVVLMAVAFGISLRLVRREQIKAQHTDYQVIGSLLTSAHRSLTIMLNWVIALVPFAVFAVVAELVGTLHWKQFQPFLNFSGAVFVALLFQISFYLIRLWFRAAVSPQAFLRGARDAILTAFFTASSAATLPITYTSVRDRVGVRERYAGLGVLVGGNFNRDGTALYEAITPLFIAQALGRPLDMAQQLMVMVMAVIASIAAPGVPHAGLVTMVLVFESVGLPPEYIPLLLAVDWLLDRCRTVVNVLGGMTMTCLLDRRTIPYAGTDDPDDIMEPEI